MAQIGVLYRLVATITCFVCLGFNVGMCSESDALIKTYVSSSLPSNDGLVMSAKLKVHKISGSEWDSLVIDSEVPVMVMFTAYWCGPCRVMSPMFDKLASQFTDGFKFYTLDVDQETDIAERYAIRSMPTTIVFKSGNVVARVTGVDLGRLTQIARDILGD
ncbi:Thioredoxin domain-containing protein [Hirschfeldia incana]|nr:Thioredoxin domain-containing protein [Hirschfeldia incana]